MGRADHYLPETNRVRLGIIICLLRKGGSHEKREYSRFNCHVCHACVHYYGWNYDVYALFGLKEVCMEQKTGSFFWIVCLITSLGAIFWSATSLMQQVTPLFIAFLVINVISLITNAVCWIIDVKKSKKKD